MADRATCDKCGKEITTGNGYLFYSPSGIQMRGVPPVPLLGHIFYCGACADSIVDASAWSENVSQELILAEMAYYDAVHPTNAQGEPVEPHPHGIVEALRRIKAWSVVAQGQKCGLTADQAKAKGRELALRWWVDRPRAEVDSAEFWSTIQGTPANGAAPSPGGYWKVSGSGIAVGITVLLCLISIPFAVMMMENEKNAARAEGEKVRQLLKIGNGSAVYATSSLAMRAETSEAKFVEAINGLDIVGHAAWEEKSTSYRNSPAGWILNGYCTGPGNKVVPITLEFVKDPDGTWKLWAIRRTAGEK